MRGRHAEAREHLTAAVDVLRADPDTDTVRALEQLALLEVFAGSAEGGQLTDEALALGQAFDVGPSLLCGLLDARGIYFSSLGRHVEAIAYFRESARVASQAGDNIAKGRALCNLAVDLGITDPAAGAEAAREAASCVRQTGARDSLAIANINLASALLLLGDWDAAEDVCARADSDGLAEHEIVVCQRAWQAALRGQADAAENDFAAIPGLLASEDPQDQAAVSVVAAFIAAARLQPREALSHCQRVLSQLEAIGLGHDFVRWAWPLAARAAEDLGDTAAVDDLLTLLDTHRPGQPGPMLRAERALVRARRAARDGDHDALAGAVAACAPTAPLTTSPTASWTTRSSWPGRATRTRRRRPSGKPAPSASGCAASRFSAAWTPSPPNDLVSGPSHGLTCPRRFRRDRNRAFGRLRRHAAQAPRPLPGRAAPPGPAGADRGVPGRPGRQLVLPGGDLGLRLRPDPFHPVAVGPGGLSLGARVAAGQLRRCARRPLRAGHGPGGLRAGQCGADDGDGRGGRDRRAGRLRAGPGSPVGGAAGALSARCRRPYPGCRRGKGSGRRQLDLLGPAEPGGRAGPGYRRPAAADRPARHRRSDQRG